MMSCSHPPEIQEHGHCDLPSCAHMHAARDKLKVAVMLGILILAVEVTGGIFANKPGADERCRSYAD